jgi:tetratricopeptide (TPR) repeat protein
MLDLARGDRNAAVKKMYAAYEHFRSVRQKDNMLSYRLALIFKNSNQLGAAREFLESALISLRGTPSIFDNKPEALLDYADVLTALGRYNDVVKAVTFFENRAGTCQDWI